MRDPAWWKRAGSLGGERPLSIVNPCDRARGLPMTVRTLFPALTNVPLSPPITVSALEHSSLHYMLATAPSGVTYSRRELPAETDSNGGQISPITDEHLLVDGATESAVRGLMRWGQTDACVLTYVDECVPRPIWDELVVRSSEWDRTGRSSCRNGPPTGSPQAMSTAKGERG